jgi:hypothetical protein
MSYVSYSAPENPALQPERDGNNTFCQIAIRRVLRLNEKRKLSGKPRGQKWIRAKQAECAIYGHIPPQNGNFCYYCGAAI